MTHKETWSLTRCMILLCQRRGPLWVPGLVVLFLTSLVRVVCEELSLDSRNVNSSTMSGIELEQVLRLSGILVVCQETSLL